MKDTAWIKRLNRYGQALADIETGIRRMSDDELSQLIADTTKAGPGNCWWAIYRMAPLVHDLATSEQMHRRVRAI